MSTLSDTEREATLHAIAATLASKHGMTDCMVEAAERAVAKLRGDADAVAQYQIRYARPLPGGDRAEWINCYSERQYRDALATLIYEGRLLYER
jgi:hypothetical protein